MKLNSKAQQPAAIGASTAIKLAKMKTGVWWRYENTDWNLADYFSRSDLLGMAEERLGVYADRKEMKDMRKWIKGE